MLRCAERLYICILVAYLQLTYCRGLIECYGWGPGCMGIGTKSQSDVNEAPDSHENIDDKSLTPYIKPAFFISGSSWDRIGKRPAMTTVMPDLRRFLNFLYRAEQNEIPDEYLHHYIKLKRVRRHGRRKISQDKQQSLHQ